MIKRLRLEYPISTLCRGLKVSVSGYYSWSTRKPSRRAQEDTRLEVENWQLISGPDAHAALSACKRTCRRMELRRKN